eukprot:1320124-Amorphochlora_amoeboformis.AAC.3
MEISHLAIAPRRTRKFSTEAIITAVVGFCAILGFAASISGHLGAGVSSRSLSTVMRPSFVAPMRTVSGIDRMTECHAGKNHLRRTTKTIEKGEMPTDIEILGPDPLQRKSAYPKLADTKAAKDTWFVIDAKDQILGRMSTLAATL